MTILSHGCYIWLMSRLRFVIPALFLAMTCVQGATSRPVEIRAVWMDRNSIPKTEQGIRDLVRKYSKAGINLIHPEVIFNGYAAYRSSYLPQKDLWNGLDMLDILIDEAHKKKMEVHPWVWVFRAGYVNDKGGILSRHPDWAMVDKEGHDLTNDSYWLDPCNPAVRRTLLGAYRELAEKYPIDGIQLDYIRFPSPDHGYNDDCRDKFKAEYGIDPVDIQPFTKPVIDWHLWRENLLNTFVEDVQREMLWVGRDLQVSAAVASFPDQARLSFLQDWEFWTANRWVDFVAPMDYTADIGDFMDRIHASAEKITHQALLAPGIGLHLQKDAQPMLTQIELARAEPVEGVTLFATAYLDEPRLKALGEGPFKEKAELPFRKPTQSAKKLLDSAKGRLKEGAPLGDVTEAASEAEAADRLLKHQMYEMLGLKRVVQFPPNIFIPEEVVPIPETGVPLADSAPVIDGKLDDPAWQTAAKIQMKYTNLGGPAAQPTDVCITRDAERLYIAYRCFEPRVDHLKANVTEQDGPIFEDDSVEVFLDIKGDGKDYYHFAVNSLGTKYESHGYDTAFNPDWSASAQATADDAGWCAEMAIPISALKAALSGTWRANFCRNRMVTSEAQNMCWSPTYGSFHTPIRFGTLVFTR